MNQANQPEMAEPDPVRPFTGIRILDLTHKFGRYAPRLFADLGAEVIRVEPPGGLPDRVRATGPVPVEAFGFAFLNAGKNSIVLDLETNQGLSQMADLVKSAQIVFLERGAPLADKIAWVRSANPDAVVTIISPYGLDGPLEQAPANDLSVQAAGGIAWLSGRPGEPPLRLPFDQSTMVTSVYAAVATSVALMDAEAEGNGHLIDVSAQECIAHSLQNALQVYDLERRVSHRGGEGTRDASEDIFACKDGTVFLAAPPGSSSSWVSLNTWLKECDDPAAAEFAEPRWLDRRWRNTAEAKQIFRRYFEAFIATRTRQELLQESLKRRVVLAPVNRVSDVLDDPQLAYRNYFVQVAEAGSDRHITFPGAPYKLSEPVWRTSPAPSLGQHDESFVSR
jgi:benzylsuccinate CoA-transferase BbsE subunit